MIVLCNVHAMFMIIIILYYVDKMAAKNKFKNEITMLKKELNKLKKKEYEMNSILSNKETAEKMSSNLLTLFKIMMEENKATRLLIQQTYEKISRLEEGIVEDDDVKTSYNLKESDENLQNKVKEIAISDLDKKIIQYIQIKGMASAADIQKLMGYKGKNAATSRLTKLYKEGILERYQLGHKVFYKFDAGKATANVLIISPP